MERRGFIKKSITATALVVGTQIPGKSAVETVISSITIYQEENFVIAKNEKSKVILKGNLETESSAIIQKSINLLEKGGQIILRTGTYYLSESLILDSNTRITGEGRRSILVPPVGDFAIKVIKTENSLLSRRMLNPPWMNSVMYGAVLDNFSIEGLIKTKPANSDIFSGNGKGIFIDEVSDFTLKDLWIVDTHDGAGLYLGSPGSLKAAREGIVDNVHFVRNGNPDAKEAAIVIAGNCNNIHLTKIFVLYPNYIGMEIGPDKTPEVVPRLIFISNSMFHGMLPETDVHPFDLIKVTHLDSIRGVVIRDTRLTHCGNEKSYLHVANGDVKIHNCILGGGHGKYAIRAEKAADVTISSNTFHEFKGKDDQNYSLFCEGSSVKFKDNIVYKGGGEIELKGVQNSVLAGNTIDLEGEPAIRISEGGQSSTNNLMIAGNFFRKMESEVRAISVNIKLKSSIIRDNFYFSGK